MGEIPVSELNKLSFASFVFHLRATTELHLPPYKGSTLRGAFGIVFKDTVCVMDHRDCDRCILRLKCAYPYIFDTPIPQGSVRMRKYERAPHPFVIEPPLDTSTSYEHGSSLSFGLTLIGKAIDYLPYFIYTFERLGRERGIGRGRGGFEVDRVGWVDAEGAEKEVYNGHLHAAPDFHVIIRSLLRRLSNLAYFHCGEELKLDFKGIIERAKEIKISDGDVRWHDWERYSARQDTRLKMGGFVGRVEYRGELGEFVPLLKLGEKIHLGKGTGFGLGKYKIIDYDHEQRARVTSTK